VINYIFFSFSFVVFNLVSVSEIVFQLFEIPCSTGCSTVDLRPLWRSKFACL